MPRRGGYAKGALSKEVIIEAAVELFGINGYTGTSLRDVAKHSGLTHSGLLHHFPNKVALLTAVLERKDKGDHKHCTEQHSTKMLSPRGFMHMVSESQQNPEITRLFTMLATEATNPTHPAHEYFVGRYRWVQQVIVDMMQASQEAGAMHLDMDLQVASRMMMAVMDGMQLQWLLEEDHDEVEVDMPAVMAEFLKLLNINSDAPGASAERDEHVESEHGESVDD